MSPMESHKKLISRLQLSATHLHSSERIETHISTVLLTPKFAYKFKKPVNFGFLDFTRLADRKHYCDEEIRLNSRLAPSIYLQTVAITGPLDRPEIDGQGDVIDYAVKMSRFDQSGLFDKLLNNDQLTRSMIDSLSNQIARFHENIPPASNSSSFGQARKVLFPMQQNFDQLRTIVTDSRRLAQLATIENWTRKQFAKRKALLKRRKKKGFIRECHGDMHLGNIVLSNREVTIFDGIEFNDELRWIDVISELAFITMDLTDQGASHFAHRLLNRYLEKTGDYGGLKLLRFYQVYLAMVRAKVTCLGLHQSAVSKNKYQLIVRHYQGYVDLAEQFTHTTSCTLFMMYGLSGSGKSTVSGELVEKLGAIRIRSDRERKRMFGDFDDRNETINSGVYNPAATEKTYRRLLKLAKAILGAGFSVIVDATFLKYKQRKPFHLLAKEMEIDSRVLQLTASMENLTQRVKNRHQQSANISDATEEVIIHQQKMAEPPGPDESHFLIDTNIGLDKLSDEVLKVLHEYQVGREDD